MDILILAVVALAMLAAPVYCVLSKKVSRTLRLAAIAALALCGLSAGVCAAIIVFAGGAGGGDAAVPGPVPAAAPGDAPVTPVRRLNITGLLIALGILLAVLAVIVVLGLRERRRQAGASPLAGGPPGDDQPGDGPPDPRPPPGGDQPGNLPPGGGSRPRVAK